FDFAKSETLKEVSQKIAGLQAQLHQSGDPREKRAKSEEVQWYKNRMDSVQNRANKSVVQHEDAHQLLYNFNLHSRKGRNPPWFVEGLATLFEPPPTEGAGAGFNIINQDRLSTLRDIDKKGGKFELEELIKTPTLIEGDAGKNYAEAWSLVYYISKY